jgi:hypothetical protein
MDFWWDTLYRSGWFWRTIQCISRNSSPGCLGRSHNIQEMDGMHCPGPGRSHKIQKMVGYTVPVWVVLANDTVYQLQQFTRLSGSVAQYIGNGWDALPGSRLDEQHTENGGIYCTGLALCISWMGYSTQVVVPNVSVATGRPTLGYETNIVFEYYTNRPDIIRSRAPLICLLTIPANHVPILSIRTFEVGRKDVKQFRLKYCTLQSNYCRLPTRP